MIKIIGITGSLRAGSFNTALLGVAKGLVPSEATLEIATLKGIPLYDGDIEANEGIPQAVIALQERIAAADGLLLATPEYNNSIPGVFKNAIDWLSRPPSGIVRVFGGRPVAVIGTRPWFGGRLLVSRAQHVSTNPAKWSMKQHVSSFGIFLSGLSSSFKLVENCKAEIMRSHPKSFHGESL